MNIKLLLISFLLLTTIVSYGQHHTFAEAQEPQGKTVVFRFVADNDTFYIPWQDNGEKLDDLVATIEHYKGAITSGQAKISVDGYCSFYATTKENLKSAAIRANRVKSKLILRNGIEEDNFRTMVHATSFEGWKSVVVVTLRVPQIQPPVEQKPEPKPEAKSEPKPEPQKEVVEQIVVEKEVTVLDLEAPAKPYCFAVRTNLLYDAFLLPTLGIEWRVSDRWGVKVDGSRSWWGNKTDKVQKVWIISPEVRYYMGDVRRWYAGVAGNFGEYNIYKGMLGNLISKDTGYQGSFWNAGISGGYQLPLSKAFMVDFNLGLGYSRFSYDSFEMVDRVRVYKDKNRTRNFFGPTQIGVNLIWTIGGNN